MAGEVEGLVRGAGRLEQGWGGGDQEPQVGFPLVSASDELYHP